MKKILLYGLNYSPELTGVGKYTGEMAEWLAEHGHDVTVVTSHPYYPAWRVFDGHDASRFTDCPERGVRVLRCPLYVPGQPSVLKRLLLLFSFVLSSSLALFKLRKLRPDLIVCIIPTLFCVPQIWLYARLTGARLVLHVQDFEIDALSGLGMFGRGFAIRQAHKAETVLLRSADYVSTISAGMLERALQKGVAADRLILFPNWAEVDRFHSATRDEELLGRLGTPAGRKVVLYSGNMGEKQGLELILEAAEIMREQAVVFLLVGEGSGAEKLRARAVERCLENVVFAPLQPYELLPALLASADCHLVVQRKGIADAVLPSKLTNILAVGGNAVITAEADTTLGMLCDEHAGIAVRVEPESVEELVSGICKALLLSQPNKTAMNYARDNLDKSAVLCGFIERVSIANA